MGKPKKPRRKKPNREAAVTTAITGVGEDGGGGSGPVGAAALVALRLGGVNGGMQRGTAVRWVVAAAVVQHGGGGGGSGKGRRRRPKRYPGGPGLAIYRREGGEEAWRRGQRRPGRTRRRRRYRSGSGLRPELRDERRGRRGLAGPWPGWLAGPAQSAKVFFNRQRK